MLRLTPLVPVPHTDILPLVKYYATAWKTGVYPKITQDQVFVMARPHPALAGASGDNIGAPTGRDRVSAVLLVSRIALTTRSLVQTQDNFYAQVHLTAPAVVYMKTNNQSTTYTGVAGVNRFEAPLEIGSGVEVVVVSIMTAHRWFRELNDVCFRDEMARLLHPSLYQTTPLQPTPLDTTSVRRPSSPRGIALTVIPPDYYIASSS